MTDRHIGYLVALDADIRDDDAASTINALRIVRGVISVEPVIANMHEAIGEARAESKFKQQLIDTFFKRK